MALTVGLAAGPLCFPGGGLFVCFLGQTKRTQAQKLRIGSLLGLPLLGEHRLIALLQLGQAGFTAFARFPPLGPVCHGI